MLVEEGYLIQQVHVKYLISIMKCSRHVRCISEQRKFLPANASRNRTNGFGGIHSGFLLNIITISSETIHKAKHSTAMYGNLNYSVLKLVNSDNYTVP